MIQKVIHYWSVLQLYDVLYFVFPTEAAVPVPCDQGGVSV
jgi:hypothetical protein